MPRKTHGMSKAKLYKVWRSMKARCQNPNDASYRIYGARGIAVFPAWNLFKPFLSWATANGYREGLTIERVDNDSGYCPTNCTWIPKAEQSSNTRRCKLITWRGQTKILKAWARTLGLPYCVIQTRLTKYGWSIDAAFTRPVLAPNRRNVRVIEHNGEARSIAEWARFLGIPYGTLHNKLNRGESIRQLVQERTGKPVYIADR